MILPLALANINRLNPLIMGSTIQTWLNFDCFAVENTTFDPPGIRINEVRNLAGLPDVLGNQACSQCSITFFSM